jgi:hypothetical protein
MREKALEETREKKDIKPGIFPEKKHEKPETMVSRLRCEPEAFRARRKVLTTSQRPAILRDCVLLGGGWRESAISRVVFLR